MTRFDVAIIGAGAAGMFCAIEAGRRGRSVLLVEHAKAPGEKIRISGGGRCNFTNMHAGPGNYLSENPHFMKSALSRYTQWDFIDWVGRKQIAWHEKTLGQLFCDHSARQIIDGLVDDLREAGVDLRLQTAVDSLASNGDGYRLKLSDGQSIEAQSLVMASGGKSIPKMGATGLAYDIARQFGLAVTETRPALVPLTFGADQLESFKPLAGVALDCVASNARTQFAEAMLFTHRGLSGPAILQLSSYWREGESIRLDIAPGQDAFEALRQDRQDHARQAITTALGRILPNRLAPLIAAEAGLAGNLADQSDRKLRTLDTLLHGWELKPTGSEGYRTAEVTLGGVSTDELSSQTFEAKRQPGLYFIGEAVDVTGWLGGFNFQWAWSSGWCAGQVV